MLRDCCCSLLFFLLLYGCSSSPEGSTSGEGSTDTSYYVPKNAPSLSMKNKRRVDTVMINEMKFVPQNISVNKGDTVIWINNDLVSHCVTEELSKAWTSSPIPAGASWKMAVNQSANYYCAIHVVMKGKIEMEELSSRLLKIAWFL